MPPRRLLFWAILIASAFFAWSLAFGRDDYSDPPEADPAPVFRGDDNIAAPYGCGVDPTPDRLGCAASPPCTD